jgi:stage II sporulation protein AA (anti-sigma F factor antagonist)
VHQHCKQGAVDVIAADGPITKDTSGEFVVFVEGYLGAGQPRLVVDLSAVPLMDSAGIESLLNLYDDARRRGGKLCVSTPNPLMNDILDISEVSTVVQVYPSSTAAVASFVR